MLGIILGEDEIRVEFSPWYGSPYWSIKITRNIFTGRPYYNTGSYGEYGLSFTANKSLCLVLHKGISHGFYDLTRLKRWLIRKTRPFFSIIK